jgi:hypothetical protein
MKIYFTIASNIFSYIIKIVFFLQNTSSLLTLTFFYKISTQFSIKDKEIKDERGKRNVYIKIMYREPLLVPYTLGNTVATFEGLLNIENLM